MALRGLGTRLYSGSASYDFVGRRRIWYAVSGVILAAVLGSLLLRGLNLGIEFTGGSEFQLANSSCSVEQVRGVMGQQVEGQSIVTLVGDDRLRVQTKPLETSESNTVATALAEACGVELQNVEIRLVGPTWGQDISRKALQAMVVFLILVTLFLSVYFEWRMAVAALVALAHDLLITVGVYSVLGFEVTPATVIGVLTILGYSLYDTVVVFDKVKENTRGIASQSKVTYSQAANLAVNQTLVRSLNTSITALLPVAAILVVGWGLLGAGTLKDLALALFVGILAGTYSSIFVATPLLAQLKEREPAMRALARRVAGRGKAAETATAQVGDVKPLAPVTTADLPMATVISTGERVQPRRQPRSKRKGST